MKLVSTHAHDPNLKDSVLTKSDKVENVDISHISFFQAITFKTPRLAGRYLIASCISQNSFNEIFEGF